MPKPLKKQKEIKAWAIVNTDGALSTSWNQVHRVFQARIFTTKAGAENVAMNLNEEYKIVPITLKL